MKITYCWLHVLAFGSDIPKKYVLLLYLKRRNWTSIALETLIVRVTKTSIFPSARCTAYRFVSRWHPEALNQLQTIDANENWRPLTASLQLPLSDGIARIRRVSRDSIQSA